MKRIFVFILIFALTIVPHINFGQNLTDDKYTGGGNSGGLSTGDRDDSSDNSSSSSSSSGSSTGVTARLVIPAIYGEVSNFVNGFAHVSHTKTSIFFLNTRAKLREFVRQKMYKIIINKQGRPINNGKYYTVTDFSPSGYATVRNIALKGSNKSAIINRQGRIVFPFKYSFYRKFYKGTAPVLFSNFRWGYIRRFGNRFRLIVGPKYAQTSEFSDGMSQVQIGNNYGFVNIHGRLVIRARYNEAGDFSEGLAGVQVQGQSKYGYINKRGVMVIRAQFILTGKFSEGMAKVQLSGGYGYINRRGRLVIQPQYRYANPFKSGVASVSIDGRSYFIDKTGKKVINPNGYEYADSFSEGYAAAKKNGRYGFINRQGRWVISPQFEDAKAFSNGMAAVKVNGKWGFIARP